MNFCKLVHLIAFLFSLSFYPTRAGTKPRLSEEERVEQWHQIWGKWPFDLYNDSEGFKTLKRSQEEEIMSIPGARERWENWMQFTAGQIVPKFTERGFELINTPPVVHKKLSDAMKKGLDNWDNLRYESKVDLMYGPQSKFLDLGPLAWEVAGDLKEMHEAWAGGIELQPTSSYGIRLYLNGSSLVMHYDKVTIRLLFSTLFLSS
jgi:hypothetical protein